MDIIKQCMAAAEMIRSKSWSAGAPETLEAAAKALSDALSNADQLRSQLAAATARAEAAERSPALRLIEVDRLMAIAEEHMEASK